MKPLHESHPFPSPFTKAHRERQKAYNAQMRALLDSMPIPAPVFTGIDMGSYDGTTIFEVCIDSDGTITAKFKGRER